MLREELIKLVDPSMDRSLAVMRHADRPAVVLVVGVNGVGKTTTVGKLARVGGRGQDVAPALRIPSVPPRPSSSPPGARAWAFPR